MTEPPISQPGLFDAPVPAHTSRVTAETRRPATPTKRITKAVKPLPATQTAPSSARKVPAVPRTTSGQVPVGDVRLTANINESIHLQLKIVAAKRRTTIGELIEELVEKYLESPYGVTK